MTRSPPDRPSPSGAGDPIDAARRWLRLIVAERDVPGAWRLMTPDYRLALTQAIIFLNEHAPLLVGYERDELARRLAVVDPDHPLWASFAGLLAEEFSVDLGDIDLDSPGAAIPRRVRPGYELVLFPRGEDPDPVESVEMQAHGVLMRRQDDRWLVAGLSQRPATPGWPPDLGY